MGAIRGAMLPSVALIVPVMPLVPLIAVLVVFMLLSSWVAVVGLRARGHR